MSVHTFLQNDLSCTGCASASSKAPRDCPGIACGCLQAVLQVCAGLCITVTRSGDVTNCVHSTWHLQDYLLKPRAAAAAEKDTCAHETHVRVMSRATFVRASLQISLICRASSDVRLFEVAEGILACSLYVENHMTRLEECARLQTWPQLGRTNNQRTLALQIWS